MTRLPPSPRIPEQAASTQAPVLTKAVLSLIFGFLSIPSCFCFAVPSFIFGGLAIWLGIWVLQNFRGTTASEFANLYAWAGIILGSLGVMMGLFGIGMMLMGGAASIMGSMRQATP